VATEALATTDSVAALLFAARLSAALPALAAEIAELGILAGGGRDQAMA
jgi:hypothetical protein